MPDKVSVLGGGNGGHTLAADLALRGYEVTLFELPQFKETFSETLVKKQIEISGLIEGTAELYDATIDPKAAVKDSKYILVSQPAFGHETTSAAVMPYLCSGQKLVFIPGNASTIALRNIFFGKNIFLAETNTLPYGCRIKHENGLKVHVSVLPGQISLGAFPSGAIDEFSDFSELINRRVVKANTALEAALNNPNPLVHPTGVLLNAGGIEQFDELNFYKGYTSSVMRVLDAKDRERLAIGSKLDYNLLKYEDFGGKDINGNSDSFINCGMKAELGKPAINGRYITEDVPYGLSLWASLADLVGVDVPIMKAEIRLASVMNNADYFKSGRTLESLGFHNAQKQDVEAVLSGYK